MGQEIGVTPIQLVTMASTIANGGSVSAAAYRARKNARLQRESEAGASGVSSGAQHSGHAASRRASRHHDDDRSRNAQHDGRSRVSGTGSTAQLNGYSAAGKTGTAQKIDVRTHTYSKTKYIASFVGFAPVNNPAITVAVVIDSPSVGSALRTSSQRPGVSGTGAAGA